jgi:hypothetical protein
LRSYWSSKVVKERDGSIGQTAKTTCRIRRIRAVSVIDLHRLDVGLLFVAAVVVAAVVAAAVVAAAVVVACVVVAAVL